MGKAVYESTWFLSLLSHWVLLLSLYLLRQRPCEGTILACKPAKV